MTSQDLHYVILIMLHFSLSLKVMETGKSNVTLTLLQFNGPYLGRGDCYFDVFLLLPPPPIFCFQLEIRH